MLEGIKESANYIANIIGDAPQVGIVLGTGLGGVAHDIDVDVEIPYEDIPNFPVSTVEGHSGKLLIGDLGGKRVMAMQGRFHYYEGYNMKQVVHPIRVMNALGIKTLMVSNASGGVNPDFEIGEIMLIDDHINLFPENPLHGKNLDELGPRFPDMSEAYSQRFLTLMEDIASKHNIKTSRGVYAGLTGPTLETPAEYKYIRIIGADAVGMSTVPEVIAARHMGMKVFAVSVVTDLGVPGKIVKVTHEDVQAVAEEAEPKLRILFKEFLAAI